MRIADEHTLIKKNPYPSTSTALSEIRTAVKDLHWPEGSGSFTIHPELGREGGKGNGVKPIKTAFVVCLKRQGWESEVAFPLVATGGGSRFGAMDAAKQWGKEPPVMVEWETGNISSSHRSMNKLALGLATGSVSAGVLLVPSGKLAPYLTDRIGNIRELIPYFPLWSKVQVQRGSLVIIEVEHDAESTAVPRITKGTDGRALL